MSPLWIKICGITRHQDALAANRLGASAIGLVFHPPSPRAIAVERVGEIVGGLDSGTQVVALFVDPEAAAVRRVLATGAIHLLQFHGRETPAFCQSFGVPWLKALRVGAGQPPLQQAARDYGSAAMLLLDSFDEAAAGGTGRPFDWNRARALSARDDVKVVVAGGLSPDNVQEATRRLRPFGVDVSSGVEAAHGIKDFARMQSFIENARNARV